MVALESVVGGDDDDRCCLGDEEEEANGASTCCSEKKNRSRWKTLNRCPRGGLKAKTRVSGSGKIPFSSVQFHFNSH
jgi:hypothetical protein